MAAATRKGRGSITNEDAVGEVSRRDLFSQARSALAEAAADAASTQMDMLVGRRSAGAPTPQPDRRRWQLLDDLHAAGLPADDTVVPRSLAPRVDIDPERCSGCALCAGFCPTQALRKAGKAAGAKDADAYLAEWRKVPGPEVEGDPDALASAEAARLEAEFDTARLKTLIDAEGWAKA